MSGERILGIDLGTTNSVMAIIDGETPVIIPNAEGHNTTPSVVSFLPTGEIIVGEIARRQAATNVANTIFSVKRLMGRDPNEVGDDLDFFSCPISSDQGQTVIEIGGQHLTPAEVSAEILRKLKNDAETQLGEPIEKAIITVPAYFDDRQRQATIHAGKLAGLDVMRIINEPTAAAMSYGLGRTAEEKIAVFDFGGGTFDLSILDLTEGAFEVITSLGDSRLGGDDIDIALVDMMLEKFHDEQGIDLGEDDLAIRRIKEAAEKAKRELSVATSTLVSLPFIAQTESHPLHLEITLTRNQIEELIEPLVERCLRVCATALKDADLKPSDITKVILVGGSTRIPLVQAAVEDFFGTSPHKGVNPDEIVALGAATQGGVLSGALEEVVLVEVTPFSLGIETKGDKVSTVIEKNTTIPIKMAKVFTTTEDDQALVNIHVVQGSAEKASENVSLGRFALTDIPAATAGTPRIRVSFMINADGVVSIEAEDLASGQSQSLTIIHSFDERGTIKVIGDESEEGEAPKEIKKRPNRWRDRRKRDRDHDTQATPLNKRIEPHGTQTQAAAEAGDVDFIGAAEASDGRSRATTQPIQPIFPKEADLTEEENNILHAAREQLDMRADDTQARGAYRTAISVLEGKVVDDNCDPAALRLLGELHLACGEIPEARGCFTRHMLENPAQDLELKPCYDRLVELHPHAVEARVDRAKLRARLGEIDAGIEDLQSLSGPEARSTAVIAQLIDLMKIKLGSNPSPEEEFKLVKLHLQLNDLDEAIALLQRLINDPEHAVKAGSMLGLCFWQKHMHYLAWQRFRQLPVTEEIKDILYRLSQDMESNEDLEGAQQVLTHLCDADAKYRDATSRLSKIQSDIRSSKRGRRDETDPADIFAAPESQIDDVRFSILGEINRGSMGVIYKGKDNVLDEVVAIKVLNAFLSSDPNAVERFKREARAAKRLSHPNIVRIHDMFEKGTKKFLSMEYIDGSDLKTILKTQGPLDPHELVRITCEICAALAYAHRLEIIHRDIKPANIMIMQRTRGVKITDFGIAKCLDATDSSGTGTMIMGTPLYMAPEQVEGRSVDARTDLYSLGVFMYELISGKPPFTEGNIEYHHVNTEPSAPDNCPPVLSEVIMRCLIKDPSERYQSADDLSAELKSLELSSAEEEITH